MCQKHGTGFFIDGYNFIHRNRCGNVRGGGVGIYLKNTFLYQRLSDIEYIDIEQLWVSVNHLKHTFIIAVIYRPPNQDLKVFLDNMRRTLNSLYNIVHRHTVFITGDFNIDQVNDNNYEFTELFEQFGFVQIVNDFTRITNTSATIIDLIFTNSPNVDSSTVIEKNISDHCVIQTSFKLKTASKITPRTISFRPWHTINLTTLKETFATMTSVADSAEYLQSKLIAIIDAICPIKSLRVTKPFAPWMKSQKILNTQAERDTLKKIYAANKLNDNIRKSYRILVRKTDSVIKEERCKFLRESVQTGDSRSIWRLVRKLLHNNNNDVTTDPAIYNRHYITTFERIIKKKPPTDDVIIEIITHNKPYKLDCFEFQKINESDVILIIKRLKPNKIGSCGINSSVLKDLSKEIAPELAYIINTCITNANFPEILKRAKITPIAKVKKPKVPTDYRPISIQTTLSKILELAMLNQIDAYLRHERTLYCTQYGFRRGLSTTNLLRNVSEKTRFNLNKGMLTVIILLDFSKAFDTLNYAILIKKLINLKFSSNALNLIASFLRGRVVQTVVNNKGSKWENIYAGVPQGSILGPTLFKIYVSDLITHVPDDAVVYQYADDCQILLTFSKRNNISDILSKIENILQIVKKWSNTNDLALNSQKTQLLPIFNKNTLFSKMNIFENGTKDGVFFTRTALNLGITYNSGLGWSNHFDGLLLKTRKSYQTLRQFFNQYTTYKDKYLRFLISTALLQSRMTFSSDLFFHSTSDCHKKWKVMNRLTASLILQKYCSDIDVSVLRLPSLINIIKYKVYCQIGSETQHNNPETNIINIKIKDTIAKTRSTNQLSAIFPSTKYQHSIEEYGAKIFNSLSWKDQNILFSGSMNKIKSNARLLFLYTP